MEALANERFVAYGGPAGDRNRVVLVIEAPDEETVHARLADDPWAPAGLLRTQAVEPWATWLGSDDRIDAPRPHYLVAYGPGPDWEHSKSRRQQDGWDEHARFMDARTDEGLVIVGGPLDERRAAVVMQHDDEPTLRSRVDEDPWAGHVLAIESVERWSLWLPPRARRL